MSSFDTDLLLFLNTDRIPELDSFFWYVSEKWVWIAVYLWMLFSLYKRNQGRKFLLTIACLVGLLICSDQVASGIFKKVVKRERPTYTDGVKEQLHLVHEPNGQVYKGGRYGFYSSHASNYMAVTVFFIMLLRPMKRWIYVLLFLWVFLISYSRLYMGVHFPTDVLMGWVMGGSFGLFFSYVFFRVSSGPYFLKA